MRARGPARLVRLAAPAPGLSMAGFYEVMAALRDDARGVPVHLMVGRPGNAQASALPGLYLMDGTGDALVRSTGGVEGVERLPGDAGPPGTTH